MNSIQIYVFECSFVFKIGLELDEEPAEVEVKPILRSQVNISVVVEPPSSEDSSQARPVKEEEEGSDTNVRPSAVQQDNDNEEEEQARETAIAGLGERIVEGAEEPTVERSNAGAARGIDLNPPVIYDEPFYFSRSNQKRLSTCN